MSSLYDAIEERFQTLLQGLTGTFATTAQVTRGDWRPMDRGISPTAVLFPGAVSPGDHWAAGGEDYIWSVNCDLIVRYLLDGTSWVTLEQTRDAVIALIQKYPTLNALGNCAVGPVNGGDMLEIRNKEGDGPFFIATTLTWQVTQLSVVTGGEIP